MDVRFNDVLAFAVAQWRQHPRAVALAGGLMFGATIAEIFTPVAIGRLVDALGANRAEPGRAAWALAAVIGLGVLFQLLQKSGDYLWARVAVAVMRRIGAEAFAEVQRFASDWHADTFAGSTVRDITRGVWAFDLLSDALYFQLGPAAAVTLGAAVLMLWHWPVMGLVFLAGALLYTAVSIRLSLGYVAPLRRRAVESDSRIGGALADALTCNAVVKSTAAEEREDARLGGILDVWQANMQRAWYASVHTGVVQNAMLIVLQAALIGGALWLWSRGQASPGEVAYVLTSFLLVGRWLRDVGMQLRIAQQAANDLERLIEYHRAPATAGERGNAVALAVERGAIGFEGVTFH